MDINDYNSAYIGNKMNLNCPTQTEAPYKVGTSLFDIDAWIQDLTDFAMICNVSIVNL